MTFGVYSEATAREIYRRTMQAPPTTGNNPGENVPPGSMYYVVTEEALLPATDPFTGYTDCDCRILRYIEPPDLLTPYHMEEGTGANSLIKVINRSAYLSVPIGTLLIVAKLGVEFAVIWADCANVSASTIGSTVSGSSTVSSTVVSTTGIGSSSSSSPPPP